MNAIYNGLSGIKIISKSYSFKFLFVAFAGIHVPLIGLVIYIFTTPNTLSPVGLTIITLVLTLVATGGTLFILSKLLEPLKVCKNSMEDYLNDRIIPDLPTQYKDEAGILMQRVQETITSLDMLLEEKKDLISLLSHDLRTPLTGILLMSSGMEKTAEMSDSQRKKMAGMISGSAREQICLFQRILEILKNDDIRNTHLNFKQINVENLLKNSKEQMITLAAQKNLSLQVDIIGAYVIIADEDLLTQVIKNLINNAIKFSHPNSTIHIAANRKENHVCISVSDEGVGFNPEDAEELFTRYTDKRKPGTNNEVSTGMGLYLSSKIVKAHDGVITAESQGLNKGATFTVELN